MHARKSTRRERDCPAGKRAPQSERCRDRRTEILRADVARYARTHTHAFVLRASVLRPPRR